jgi:hypothetical protein
VSARIACYMNFSNQGRVADARTFVWLDVLHVERQDCPVAEAELTESVFSDTHVCGMRASAMKLPGEERVELIFWSPSDPRSALRIEHRTNGAGAVDMKDEDGGETSVTWVSTKADGGEKVLDCSTDFKAVPGAVAARDAANSNPSRKYIVKVDCQAEGLRLKGTLATSFAHAEPTIL